MKTITLFVLSLLLIASYPCFGFNYTITFTGSGASTTVDSVIVQNLTKGTKVSVLTGNELNLTGTTAVELLNANDEFIRIYPNFVEGKSTVSFFAKQAGNTQINIYSIEGKKIAGITENLQTGVNSFLLSLPNGSFVIQVTGNEYAYTTKMISQGSMLTKSELVYIGNEKLTFSSLQKNKNSKLSITTMDYTIGDQLLYKAISGNYSTIVTDKPTGNKTTNFGFVDCTDADENHYTVVTIGSQTWMAENLRATHYHDGGLINNVTDNTTWITLTIGAWCDYSNLASNGTKYGHLYNWYTANGSRNIAPTGWHIPTDDEWTTLIIYLGGENIASYKLKKVDNNWSSPSGLTNESGFSALPGSYRNGDSGGVFGFIGYGFWWSSTMTTNALYAWSRDMSDYESIVHRANGLLSSGFSVRCIRD